MKVLKTIAYLIDAVFLVVFVFLYVYYDKFVQQFKHFILFAFLKYWLIGGFVLFFISLIIANSYIILPKSKVQLLKDKITALKAKIYDNALMQQATQDQLTTSPDKEITDK